MPTGRDRLRGVLCFLLLLGSGALLWAAGPPLEVTQSRRIPSPEGGSGFAVALAAWDDILVVGDSSDAAAAHPAGIAFVFERRSDGWHLIQEISSPDPKKNDQFASSMAVHGSTLVISEWLDTDAGPTAGAVFIYQRRTDGAFEQTQKLVHPDPRRSGFFGSTLDLTEDLLVIGARSGSLATQTVYIYTRDAQGSWTLAQKVIPDPKTPKQFGLTLAAHGKVILAGLNHNDDLGEDSGTAYVIAPGPKGAWAVVGKLLPPSGVVSRSYFGSCADVDANTFVLSTNQGGQSSRVYIFERTRRASWTLSQTLGAPDPGLGEGFGLPVLVRGDVLLVGARREASVGAVYAYRQSPAGGQWEQVAKLTDARAPHNGNFGQALAFANDRVFVGEPGYGPDAVFVFGLPRPAPTSSPGPTTR